MQRDIVESQKLGDLQETQRLSALMYGVSEGQAQEPVVRL